MVIRGEHVRRWISLAPAGGRDEVLVRAGRILDGGTTAPARSEAVVHLNAGTDVLAAACRRLLAEAASEAERAPRGGAASGSAGPAERERPGAARAGERHTGFGSWVIVICVVGVIGLYVYSNAALHG